MKHDDEDDVLGIDLDAWQPPPPPASTADAVIARMRRENTAVTAQALPVETAPPMSKRWWLVGGVTVAIAASTVLTFALTRGPNNARGISAGDRAAHIELGPSSADVEPNTVVSWRRDGDRITAQQAGGAATWRIDDDDTLRIETGLGSIEATSASLRVEVKMLDEKKTIALSAVTAAAVAVVTIVVYEGVVKADGKTVEPGTVYQIKQDGPTVIDEQITVGASPDLVAKVADLEAELAAKQAEIEALRKPDAPPEGPSRAMIQKTMSSLVGRIKACANGFEGKLELTVRVKPDGSTLHVYGSSGVPEQVSDCVIAIVEDASFGASKDGGTFRYPIAFTTPVAYDFSPNPFAAPKKKCDADALLQKGRDHYMANRPADALVLFEQSYACDANAQTLKLAFASACKSKNLFKARVQWQKLKERERNVVLQFCVMSGITLDQLEVKAEVGRLMVANSRPATVLLDGVSVGTTPVDLEVPAGKHKVTLVVGGDKHTFAVNVKAGEVVVLHKQLDALE